MVEAFKGTPYDTGLDQNKLAEIAEYFRPMREEALQSGLMNTKVLGVNIKTLMYQVPGGMLSNLVSQLKEMGQEDKYEKVLEEVPRVRKDFGEPPLVTPSSQIVGTQAVLNVVNTLHKHIPVGHAKHHPQHTDNNPHKHTALKKIYHRKCHKYHK